MLEKARLSKRARKYNILFVGSGAALVLEIIFQEYFALRKTRGIFFLFQ